MAKKKNKMDGVFLEYIPLAYEDPGLDLSMENHEVRAAVKKIALYLVIGVVFLAVEIVVFMLLANAAIKV